MAFSRYTRDGSSTDGEGLTVSQATVILRRALANGTIGIQKQFTTTQADRLDHIAGQFYGDGRYWWVIAAASDIGWGLQVPEGTLVSILDLRDVELLVG